MTVIRNVAPVVLFISFWTFVAFFGRLPALRNTPIGALHRVIWIHIPHFLQNVDQRLSNGRISASILDTAHRMWNDRHPIVMIFFILLLFVSECMFLPPAWPLLSTVRKINATIIILMPYILLYAAAVSDPGYITPENHADAMTLYPYDFTIYYPGHQCRTCHLLKPARSKHCSICNRCISRLDHHCIFIDNCVGYGNQHWFLLLLLSTAILTTYGTYIGASLLSAAIRLRLPSWTLTGKGFNWSQYFNILGWALQEMTRTGAVTLLCLLTTPLVFGLLGYHIYLIWAGTTTNESMKWSDLREDMSDGCAFKRQLPKDRQRNPAVEPFWTTWPVESEQILLRTVDGKPPKGRGAIGVGEWQQVWKLADVENMYDMGFWDNVTDVFLPRHGILDHQKQSHSQKTPGQMPEEGDS